MEQEIFQHFHDEEHTFIQRIEAIRQQALSRNYPMLMPFLNPREQFVMREVFGKPTEYHYEFWGGDIISENKRAIITPTDYSIEHEDFELALIQIEFATKFNQLKHSQILGTLLGSGIKRDRIGDIITNKKIWQVVVVRELGAHLIHTVTRIHRTPVALKEVGFEQYFSETDEWQTREIIVASLRLDLILSEIIRVSRQKSKNAISLGKVKLNWIEEKNPSKLLQEKDILSLRGFGRIRIDGMLNKTKKGKQKLQISVLKA